MQSTANISENVYSAKSIQSNRFANMQPHAQFISDERIENDIARTSHEGIQIVHDKNNTNIKGMLNLNLRSVHGLSTFLTETFNLVKHNGQLSFQSGFQRVPFIPKFSDGFFKVNHHYLSNFFNRSFRFSFPKITCIFFVVDSNYFSF